jgi:antiphage defense system Thoeris ThsB-like protein
MAKRQVFYNFHFDKDVMRVQQIRNMGVVEGDEPVSPNEWEQLKRKSGGIEKWIDDNMKYRSCVIVLIGEETYRRPWVRYEIEKAWKDKKGLFGIHIHNLKDPRTGTCRQGSDPISALGLKNGDGTPARIAVYNPVPGDPYNDIKKNIDSWVEKAIGSRV